MLTTLRMVVIPAQFQDCEFSTSADSLQTRIDKVENYFSRQFRGNLTLELELAPIVTLSHTRSYYGDNYTDRKDVLLYQAIKEACNLSSENIDFSKFDGDADGMVDNIVLLYAGACEDDGAGAELLSQQHAHLSDYSTTITLDTKTIDGYSVCCELHTDAGENPRQAGIGVMCHEIAHALGLPDLYDTDADASGGNSGGLGSSSLMDYGCTNNDWNSPPDLSGAEHHILSSGILEPLTIGEKSLAPVISSGRYIFAESDTPDEYYIFASQQSRLYVYHIDRSGNPAGYSDIYGRNLSAAERWKYNQINSRPDHKCFELVAVLPNEDQHSFGSDTSIPYKYWSGASSSFALRDIQAQSDSSIYFNVIEPIKLDKLSTYQDAVSIEWILDESLEGNQDYKIICINPIDTLEYNINTDLHYYTIEGLNPYTDYKLKLQLILSESESYSASAAFQTKRYRKDTYPNMYFTGVTRGKDGSFIRGTEIPLRIYNAGKTERVDWYFNDIPITPSARGTYTINIPGTLKAEIYYPDGTTELIIKEIRL